MLAAADDCLVDQSDMLRWMVCHIQLLESKSKLNSIRFIHQPTSPKKKRLKKKANLKAAVSQYNSRGGRRGRKKEDHF